MAAEATFNVFLKLLNGVLLSLDNVSSVQQILDGVASVLETDKKFIKLWPFEINKDVEKTEDIVYLKQEHLEEDVVICVSMMDPNFIKMSHSDILRMDRKVLRKHGMASGEIVSLPTKNGTFYGSVVHSDSSRDDIKFLLEKDGINSNETKEEMIIKKKDITWFSTIKVTFYDYSGAKKKPQTVVFTDISSNKMLIEKMSETFENFVANEKRLRIYFKGIHIPVLLLSDFELSIVPEHEFDVVIPSGEPVHNRKTKGASDPNAVKWKLNTQHDLQLHRFYKFYFKLSDDIIPEGTYVMGNLESFDDQSLYLTFSFLSEYVHTHTRFRYNLGYFRGSNYEVGFDMISHYVLLD